MATPFPKTQPGHQKPAESPSPDTYHTNELGQGQLQLDGDELQGAGGRANQVVVAGFVQKVIHELLLGIGHAAVPWENRFRPAGPPLGDTHCS